MPTFTSGDDIFTVSAAGTYSLDMLGGNDRLNVYGGTNVTAHLGDGNDLAIIKAAIASIFGDAGLDRFDIYSANATVDGGADSDTINVRGGSGLSAHGGLGDDRFNFYADASSVTLYGDDGNDDFVGYNHNVTGSLNGGAGNDYFVQFRTGVTLLGGLGNDIYRVTVGSPATIVENAGEGSDSVQVARGYNYTLPDNVENISTQGFSGSVLVGATLTGNALNNHIAAHNNGDTVNGLDGNDGLGGKGGNDTLNGGNGNDYLDGGTGNDTLSGGSGDDVIQGRTGDDSMSGEAGDDTYYIDSAGDVVTENVGEGTDTARVSVSYVLGANVDNGIIQSGIGGAVLTGNDLDNVLSGNSGGDSLLGAGGNDVLKGGAGNDWMQGGIGDDIYYVDSLDDAVMENSGEGIDTVRTTLAEYVLPANVDIGEVLGNTGSILSGNELNNSLIGGNGADELSGAAGGDDLSGGAGDDQLLGGADPDSLNGGAGNDLLDGGVGFDYCAGGLGDDTYLVNSFNLGSFFNGIDDSIVENADEGYDTVIVSSVASDWVATLGDNIEEASVTGTGGGRLHGNATDNVMVANMTLASGEVMYLYGENGDDQLSILASGSGIVSLSGDSGNDALTGGDGNDDLSGGFGNDILVGGAGNDVLSPGQGNDQLTGGTGNDSFVIRPGESVSAPTIIEDFHSPGDARLEHDLLSFSLIDANWNVAGDQAFTYIGTAAFSGTAGEFRAVIGKGGAVYQLYGDMNGDSVADFEVIVHLVGTTVLHTGDLIL